MEYFKLLVINNRKTIDWMLINIKVFQKVIKI